LNKQEVILENQQFDEFQEIGPTEGKWILGKIIARVTNLKAAKRTKFNENWHNFTVLRALSGDLDWKVPENSKARCVNLKPGDLWCEVIEEKDMVESSSQSEELSQLENMMETSQMTAEIRPGHTSSEDDPDNTRDKDTAYEGAEGNEQHQQVSSNEQPNRREITPELLASNPSLALSNHSLPRSQQSQQQQGGLQESLVRLDAENSGHETPSRTDSWTSDPEEIPETDDNQQQERAQNQDQP
jgi:hypothetical protein